MMTHFSKAPMLDLMTNRSQFFGGSGSGPRLPAGMVGNEWRSLMGNLGSGGFAASLGGMSAIRDGQTMIGTVGFRYELPVQQGRLRPYVGGGLGLARTEENFKVSGRGLTQAFSDVMSRTGMTAGSGSLDHYFLSDSVWHTGMAASAGIGASVRVFRELSVDIDARYFRLDRSRNVTRLGGGVSYRF